MKIRNSLIAITIVVALAIPNAHAAISDEDLAATFDTVTQENDPAASLVAFTEASIRHRAALGDEEQYPQARGSQDQAIRQISQQLNVLWNGSEQNLTEFLINIDMQLSGRDRIRYEGDTLRRMLMRLDGTLRNGWVNSDGTVGNPTLMLQSYFIKSAVTSLFIRRVQERIQSREILDVAPRGWTAPLSEQQRIILSEASGLVVPRENPREVRPERFRSSLSRILAIEAMPEPHPVNNPPEVANPPGLNDAQAEEMLGVLRSIARSAVEESGMRIVDGDERQRRGRRALRLSEADERIRRTNEIRDRQRRNKAVLITSIIVGSCFGWYAGGKLHKKYGSHLFDAIRYKHLGLSLPDAKAQQFAQEYHEADDQREYLLGLHVFLNPQNVLLVTKAAGIHTEEINFG